MTLLRVLLEGYIPGDATGNIFKCLDSPSAVTFNTSRIDSFHLRQEYGIIPPAQAQGEYGASYRELIFPQPASSRSNNAAGRRR